MADNLTEPKPTTISKQDSPAVRLSKIRTAMVDTWLRNLTAETALPIIGHVLLGTSIAEEPELNKKEHYANIMGTEYNAESVVPCVVRVHDCSLKDIFGDETIQKVMDAIKKWLSNALTSKTEKVVARSLRLLVTHVPGPVDAVTFTLAWLKYVERT